MQLTVGLRAPDSTYPCAVNFAHCHAARNGLATRFTGAKKPLSETGTGGIRVRCNRWRGINSYSRIRLLHLKKSRWSVQISNNAVELPVTDRPEV